IALTRVDFPTLGAPMMATKPQRSPSIRGSWGTVGRGAASSSEVPSISTRWFDLEAQLEVVLDAFASQHGGGGGLLGGPLRAPHTLGRRVFGKVHGNQEFRVVVRAGAGDLAIGGRR